MIAIFAEKQARFGYAFSAVCDRGTGTLLGMAGLSRFEQGAPIAPCTEIGWRLTPSAWGKGIATEAARAWLAYGFDRLGIEAILSFAPALNIASHNVMRRIGMQRAPELDFAHPAIPEESALKPMVVYQRLRADEMASRCR